MSPHFTRTVCLTTAAMAFFTPAMADPNQIPSSSTSTFCIEPNYPGIETERVPKSEIIELYGIDSSQKLPFKKDDSTRLVLLITPEGKAVLNPAKDNNKKSSTVELKKLTREKAKTLWGEPRAMTYDLVSFSRNEMDIYHLDLCFTEGLLNSYRVRGIGVIKPEYRYLE